MKELDEKEIKDKAQSIIDRISDTDNLPSQDKLVKSKFYSVFNGVSSSSISKIISIIQQTLDSATFDKFKPDLDSYRVKAEEREDMESIRKEVDSRALKDLDKYVRQTQDAKKVNKRGAVKFDKPPDLSKDPAAESGNEGSKKGHTMGGRG